MRAIFLSYDLDEAAVLQLVLQRAGFAPQQVHEFSKLNETLIERPPDFVLAAFGGDRPVSLKMVQAFRAETTVPLVAIGEPVGEDQHIALLEAGVDLYIPRPFSARVLIAQIKTLIRRSAGLPVFGLPILSQSGVWMDPSTRTIQVEEGPIHRLTQLEFRLLYTLMTYAGRVIPTETLVEYVWGFSGEGNRGLVRGLVQRLRAKVEPDPANPKYILTEAGIGYSFNPFQDANQPASKN
jgi:two-component system, OmpR family, KDP operon response regulator KdpE